MNVGIHGVKVQKKFRRLRNLEIGKLHGFSNKFGKSQPKAKTENAYNKHTSPPGSFFWQLQRNKLDTLFKLFFPILQL